MKTEHLSALLADRALGELPPEVAALLEAWLAQNPAAAEQAAGLDTTVRLARAAVAPPREQPAPLDLARFRRESAVPRFRLGRAEMLRLAAVLALGVGLGWAFRPQPAAVPPRPAAATVARPAPSPSSPGATHFWSVTRFVTGSAQPQPRKSL